MPRAPRSAMPMNVLPRISAAGAALLASDIGG